MLGRGRRAWPYPALSCRLVSRPLPWASLTRHQTCLQVLCCGLSALEATRRDVSAATARPPPAPRTVPGSTRRAGPTHAGAARVRAYVRLTPVLRCSRGQSGGGARRCRERARRPTCCCQHPSRSPARRNTATAQGGGRGRVPERAAGCGCGSGRELGSRSDEEPGRRKCSTLHAARCTQPLPLHVAQRKRPRHTRLRMQEASAVAGGPNGADRQCAGTGHGARMLRVY